MEGSLGILSISPRRPYTGGFFEPVYRPPVCDRSTAWGWNLDNDHGPSVVIPPDHELVADGNSHYPKTSNTD